LLHWISDDHDSIHDPNKMHVGRRNSSFHCFDGCVCLGGWACVGGWTCFGGGVPESEVVRFLICPQPVLLVLYFWRHRKLIVRRVL
jgi:hypothetical protein